MPPQQVVIFIIGTVVILFGAYYVTYFIGMKASGQTRAGMRNRNIKIIDRYAFARDKSFCVVEIADTVYVLGITVNSMTVLGTYDADEYAGLTESDDEDIQMMPWSDTPVGRYGNKLTKSVVGFFAKKAGRVPEGDAQDASFADSMRKAEEKCSHSELDSEALEKSGGLRVGPAMTNKDGGGEDD